MDADDARQRARTRQARRSTREERGMALAMSGRITPHPSGAFLVASATKNVDYVVKLAPPSCTCPDRCRPCYHLIGVGMYVERLEAARQRAVATRAQNAMESPRGSAGC
jgi:hypothetical protein